MSEAAQSKLIVLWEHEIRIAAQLLMKAYALEKPDKSDEEKAAGDVALVDAFNACMAALRGADDPEVTLVLSSLPDILKARARRAAKFRKASPAAASDESDNPSPRAP